MGYRIITISREYGSGGRVIGSRIAKRLGIDFYDKKIIQEVVATTGLSEEFIAKVGEYAPTKSIFAYSFMGQDYSGYSVEDHILAAQDKIIHEAVSKGPCVIIGRSADYLLKDREDCLNVFIQGNPSNKVSRIMSIYDKDEAEAKRLCRDIDKKRSLNYQYCTNQKWGARENYDLILNSSVLGFDAIVDIICDLYKRES